MDLINKEVQSVEEVLERLKEKYSKAETLEEIVKRKDQVDFTIFQRNNLTTLWIRYVPCFLLSAFAK